jgi:hypothetical protein
MCVGESICTDILIEKRGIKVTLSIFYLHAYVEGEYDIAYRTKMRHCKPLSFNFRQHSNRKRHNEYYRDTVSR